MILTSITDKQIKDRQALTMANSLPVKHARFTEAPSFSTSVHHHPSISSSTTHQGVNQDLQTERERFSFRVCLIHLAFEAKCLSFQQTKQIQISLQRLFSVRSYVQILWTWYLSNWGNFITPGTNVHLHWWMTCLEGVWTDTHVNWNLTGWWRHTTAMQLF